MMNATKEICLTKIQQRSWGTWQVQRINPRPSGRLRISGKVRISLRGGKGGSRGGCNAETAILWSVCSVCPTTLTLPFSSTASPLSLSSTSSRSFLKFITRPSWRVAPVSVHPCSLTRFESRPTRARMCSSIESSGEFRENRPGRVLGRRDGDVCRLHVEYCWITASPRVRKGEQIKGYCIYTEASSDGSDTCGKRVLLIRIEEHSRSSNFGPLVIEQ